MNAPPYIFDFGEELKPSDLKALVLRWITPEIAAAAYLRRVSAENGRALIGAKRGDYAGLLIPYSNPDGPTGYYRIRRDVPDLEARSGDRRKEVKKYVGPPGRGSRLYFPPGVTLQQTADVDLPIIITEGEFKTLALARLASREAEAPRFLPIGLGGAWNWYGIIAKEEGANGERVTLKGPIPDLDLIQWKGRRVIIAFDADIRDKSQVKAARYRLSEELYSRGALVGFLEWDIAAGKGIDDRLANVGPEKVLVDINRIECFALEGWKARCRRTDNGKIKALLCNAELALSQSDEWRSLLAYDELAMRPYAVGPVPIDGVEPGQLWGENEAIKVNIWLQRNGVEVGLDVTRLAITAAAGTNRVHPLRDYLTELRWDGEPRIDQWLTTYCKVKPTNFSSAVGRYWLISAVARVFEPGCKADHVLVLEGKQGVGKSAGIAALASPKYFADSIPDLRSKDAAIQLSGLWILEHSEMDTLTRSEAATAKSFLSRQSDRYRAPFGIVAEDHPRQVVFAATSNKSDWATDETGGRRYWPVWTEATVIDPIDVKGIERDRDQLWAEAVAMYQEGVHWWIENEQIIQEASEEQSARFNCDVWQPLIQAWLENPLERMEDTRFGQQPVAGMTTTANMTNVLDILHHAIGKRQDQYTQHDKTRVARCLQSLGWERRQVRTKSGREWLYQREK